MTAAICLAVYLAIGCVWTVLGVRAEIATHGRVTLAGAGIVTLVLVGWWPMLVWTLWVELSAEIRRAKMMEE